MLLLTLMASVSLACLLMATVPTGEVGRRLTVERNRHHHRRLNRQLDRNGRMPLSARVLRRPTIEWVAADLRRLDRQRHGLARESEVWHAAVLKAYDNRLGLASRCLGVTEHLEQLQGVDRELERLRIEGELEAAGLQLRSPLRRRTDRR